MINKRWSYFEPMIILCHNVNGVYLRNVRRGDQISHNKTSVFLSNITKRVQERVLLLSKVVHNPFI